MPAKPTHRPLEKYLKKGLVMNRTFSIEGESPFDSVQWETRTASIKNHKGEVIFEQHHIEMPQEMSLLASNIVASKYFYGDVGESGRSPKEGGREHSFRQLVHRVTRTITDWGRAQHYFATDEDAERFYDELTWLCVNQYGAFNSPVWFNVGLYHQYGIRDTSGKTIWGWDRTLQKVVDVDPYEYPQGSACFIIAVEDSIEDIWKLMAESARLFKYGSGVGADWSKLRSSQEKLSGGGRPSGPVSFMRVQDATGGTIKSGGKTRRAAIMQTLKVWHPDIEEFVAAKQEEEKKAWALIEEGYDGSFNGPAYGSVAFQNVNQSVRVDDAFMEAATHQRAYPLRAAQSGEVVWETDAHKLLLKIAEGTHVCGDPGVQYEDTIQKWHTVPHSGPINSSNPCSEYMHVDNSACNLASLNLRKFQLADGTLDVERYRAACRIFITAQEILVDNAGYPSPSITQNSHDFRPLGLGFANLGAFIMAMGVPYDSPEGRGVAGAIMSIMTAEAYARSAEIAANPQIGPFTAFEKNQEAMLGVMQMHREAVAEIDGSCPAELRTAAQESWDMCLTLGKQYGYRNAQSTVLAPTGTIGFMMDCDTTGIEPDIALVKYKLLAGKGEGMLKIVNNTVPQALQHIGYPAVQIEEILAYIDQHDTIEGAPHLKQHHLPIFDCAFKPYNGSRFIHHLGHLRMMAACQPFISGAISKTVNVPESATIEEIAETYVEGWRLGLKAVAIYRENSKRSQPLATKKGGNTQKSDVSSAGDGAVPETTPEVIEKIVEKVVYKPTRRRLPDERPSLTHKFSVAGHEGYLHVGLYPDTKKPGEIFITMAKQGSTISGMMDAFATAISLALQYGVPVDALCEKFSHMRFEPSGFTHNPQIPMAKSITDYIFRWMALKFVGHEVEEAEDPFHFTNPPDLSDGNGMASANEVAVSVHVNNTSGLQPQKLAKQPAFQNQADAPGCPSCGSITVRSGSCYKCMNCGTTTGCS
ncbi:MAG: vitamin B12-dependent ribonucleotide reductase [Bacteroidetes Order II. Incertae sedis bacterium]|nr:vitamin B12-dependent ribonucleotide reductase [Bacteroidetes Order II. bacterium]